MASSLPLLILGEVLLVTLIVIFFMALYIRKQKTLLKKLIDKCNQIKTAYEEKTEEYTSFHTEHKNGKEQNIPEYFTASINDARQRYEQYTQAKIPKIDAAQAFSAKVAALRYLYLTAEKEVFGERGVTHAGWNMFEKKLADIVRWFAKQTTNRQDVRNNRTRLLQERIDALKPFEAENKKLQRNLDHANKRQEQLETYQRENKATILSLQKMLQTMKQSSPYGAETRKEILINKMTPEEHLAHSSSQVDSIGKISDEKNRVLKNIIFELDNHHTNISPEVRKKMESSIRMMEVEIMKSDQYITNLKKELKDAKIQATNYALMLNENKGSMSKTANEQGDSVLYLSDADKKSGLTELPSLSPSSYLDHEKVVLEIKQLRENNKSQRAIIVNLEHEISLIKDSILTTEDEGVRRTKQQEVNRLERMVKECEGCIEILESEVDHLYNQLQERASLGDVAADETEVDEEMDIVKLGMELEEMAKEMEKMAFQYRQTHAINQLIYDIVQCASIEEIATLIKQFFKGFNAPAGFCISSSAGNAEYFPSHIFNENTRELVKSFSFKDPVFYINEGTLFSSTKICLMLLPATDKTKPLSEPGLIGLVNIVEGHIQHLESKNTILQRSEGMASWIESTKNHLSDLDIQYAYQVEENTKTFNNFIAEIRQAYHLLDLKGSGLILLDNAINEYEQRMYLLLSSGDVIDREISILITHIDQLQVH